MNLIAGQSATLNGVTLNAALSQGSNSSLNITNGLTLNNTLTMGLAYWDTTVLNFNGTGVQTLSGSGSIVTVGQSGG